MKTAEELAVLANRALESFGATQRVDEAFVREQTCRSTFRDVEVHQLATSVAYNRTMDPSDTPTRDERHS